MARWPYAEPAIPPRSPNSAPANWSVNRLFRKCPAQRADVIAIPRHQRFGFDGAQPYQVLADEAPAIVEAVLAALARRFAKETARLTPVRASPKARTVALIDGGARTGSGRLLIAACVKGLAAIDAEIVDPGRLNAMFPAVAWMPPRSPTGSTSSNTQRRWWSISAAARPRHGRARAIRQADLVVFACRGDAPRER